MSTVMFWRESGIDEASLTFHCPVPSTGLSSLDLNDCEPIGDQNRGLWSADDMAGYAGYLHFWLNDSALLHCMCILIYISDKPVNNKNILIHISLVK